MLMGDKPGNNAGKILKKSLDGYHGYFEIEIRKNSATVFTDEAQKKLSPISIYAEKIATRFGKVGRVDYLKIFSEMKNYVHEFSERFHLNNFDAEFFSTRFLSTLESDKISELELELLSKLDETLISIQKESNHEFLQEIETAIPELEQKFDKTTALFEERAALINQYSERHNKITGALDDFSTHLKNMDHSASISDLIKTIENEHVNLPAISVAFMELFSSHLPSFKKISEHSAEYEMAVEYFNEFMNIISNAKVHYSRGTLYSSDRDKVKEIIKSSGNLAEILSDIKSKKSEADRKDETDKRRSKQIKFLLTISGASLVAAGAAFYFLK